MLGDGCAGFGGVIGIVQTDAQKFANIADAGRNALFAFDDGQIGRIKGAKFFQCRATQRVAGDVGDMVA